MNHETPLAQGPVECRVMREHDPNHPYVRKLIGCGHGRLFSEPCVDCEVVGLMDEYKRAVKTVMRVRNRMRQLGRPMPGHNTEFIALAHNMMPTLLEAVELLKVAAHALESPGDFSPEELEEKVKGDIGAFLARLNDDE